MTRTRPLALLVAAVVAVLAVGAAATLLQHVAASPLLAVGVAAAGLVGLVCVAGARRAERTGTAYW